MSTPLIYLVLGATGSGRREVIADLVEKGLEDTDRPAVLLEAAEAPSPVDARLNGLVRWNWNPDRTISASLPEDATHVFLLSAGRANPVDQVEAFKLWLTDHPAELARIVTVVNCQLAERHSKLLAWYDACVHFSDVVLLNRREGVANKWVSDFLSHFKHQFVPALFEHVKHGHLDSPATILVPQARRLTLIFDEDYKLEPTPSPGPSHGTLPPEPKPTFYVHAGQRIPIGEEGDDLGEESPDPDLDPDAVEAEDPYLARRNEGGRRIKEIPNIADFL